MNRQVVASAARGGGSETGVAALGTVAALTALFSAAACCILPLALAGLGIGAGGLSAFVPYRWPLTLLALIVTAAGWALYFRKRRRCEGDAACAAPGASKTPLIMLVVSTSIVAICLLWGLIEQPLMRMLA